MYTLIYSKFSNDRSPAFSIRTDILEDESGNRVVHKLAACPEAEAHIASLPHWYQVFSEQTDGTVLSYNRCTPIPGGVALEYLTGQSLEEDLLAVWKEHGIDACAQKFEDFLQFVKSLHTSAVFAPSDAFRTVFGDVRLPTGTVCASFTNIDLLCENIKMQNGKWVAIDYEWSFDFPIPVNFLLYRIILHFIDHANRGTEFMRFDFMGKMGITKEEIKAYDAMEAHFQQYILGSHVPIQGLYSDISEGYLLVEEALAHEALQIFFDCGSGFREEDSSLFPMRQGDGCQYLTQEIPLPECVRSLRLDPGNHAAMVLLSDLHFDNQSGQASFRLRDATRRGKWLYFPEDDPNLIIRRIPEGARSLFVKLEVYHMEQEPLKDAERAARGLRPKLPSLHKIKKALIQ